MKSGDCIENGACEGENSALWNKQFDRWWGWNWNRKHLDKKQ